MSYNKQRLNELFSIIYNHTTDVIEDVNKYRKYKILIGANTKIQHGNSSFETSHDSGKTLTIFDEGIDAIYQFTEELLQDDEIKIYVSSKGVEKEIGDVLQHNYGTVDFENIWMFVKESIIKPIRDNIRIWEVYVPLVNLIVENELVLGDVSFVHREVASKIINKFIDQGDYRFGGKTEKEKQGNRTAFLGQISQISDKYQAFAKVNCKSHSSHLESVATNKAFMVINCIRAFLHVLCLPSHKALWGLPQEIPSGLSGIISLDHSEKHTFNFDHVKPGAMTNFVLGESSIEKLEKVCHLKTIQEILAKVETERTSLENVIILALQAMGKAVIAPTTDMRFIGYIIAIERLLIKDGEESTTEKFTDRLVLGLNYERDKRIELAKRSKELYGKRSKMVHAASFFNIFKEDEIDAEVLAINLVIRFLGKCKEGYTHNQLCDEINSMKYSV